MKIVYLFWHEDCPRCQDFKPVFDTWAQKYSGGDFVSVPLDDPYVARKLNISTIPTVVVVDEDAESILGWFGRRLPTEEEIARLLGHEAPAPQTGTNSTEKEEKT